MPLEVPKDDEEPVPEFELDRDEEVDEDDVDDEDAVPEDDALDFDSDDEDEELGEKTLVSEDDVGCADTELVGVAVLDRPVDSSRAHIRFLLPASRGNTI